MATFRIFQQLRLWLYMAMFVTAVGMVWYGDQRNMAAFLLGLSAIILLNLEICPKCKRRVWSEGGGFMAVYVLFPVKAFWIGTECRDRAPD